MSDCDCSEAGNVFSAKTAESDLRDYLRNGPDATTRALVDAIRAEGVDAATLLDIGAGVGAVQYELLEAGAATAESVDVSPAYVEVARREAERRGFGDRIVHRQGDFVTLGAEVPAADVVTLVRVVCCYPAMPALIGRSAGHARRMVGLVYPRDTWWTRSGAGLVNLLARLRRDGTFRIHIHGEREMDELIRSAGFERRFLRRGWFWQAALYVRRRPEPAGAQVAGS